MNEYNTIGLFSMEFPTLFPTSIAMIMQPRLTKVEMLEYALHLLHYHDNWFGQDPRFQFSYNNGYHESSNMSLFGALYERICITLISWSDLVNRVLIGLNMVAETEQEMQVIKENLKVA